MLTNRKERTKNMLKSTRNMKTNYNLRSSNEAEKCGHDLMGLISANRNDIPLKVVILEGNSSISTPFRILFCKYA
jgi:hypothetical protein